jgi:hypothetical protein
MLFKIRKQIHLATKAQRKMQKNTGKTYKIRLLFFKNLVPLWQAFLHLNILIM